MGVRLQIPLLLRDMMGSRSSVDLEGNTVSECLRDLMKRYPELKKELFDESGGVSPVWVIAHNQEILKPRELDRAVSEGDTLQVLMLVAGG